MEDEWTLQSLGKYLQSIPTKQDFEKYVTRLERTYKQEIQVLKVDIQDIGDRVNEVERQQADVSPCVQGHHSAIQYLISKEKSRHHILTTSKIIIEIISGPGVYQKACSTKIWSQPFKDSLPPSSALQTALQLNWIVLIVPWASAHEMETGQGTSSAGFTTTSKRTPLCVPPDPPLLYNSRVPRFHYCRNLLDVLFNCGGP